MLVLSTLFDAGPARAQLFERPTLIRGARIVTMDGPTMEKGDILIKGGKISQVAPEIQLGLGELLTARTVDAAGKTVTPGFVDAWSALGEVGAAASPDPTSTASDAFDPFLDDDLREALQNGVTTICLGPGGVPGIVGHSVVIHLVSSEQGGLGTVAKTAAALSINLGSEQPTLARARTFADVRKKFRSATEYRQAKEDYEEDLKEYLGKLEERRKKKADATDKADKKSEADTKPGTEPPPKDGEQAPRPNEGEKPKSSTASDTQSPQTDPAAKDDPVAKGEPPTGEAPALKGEEKKDAKKEDEIKKPAKPKYDATSEALLRAIDHELPVRIEAQRSSDILNALRLAEEYNLDLVLEGATEAYLVAKKIADAKVPVILGQIVRTDLFEPNEFRRHSERNVAELSRAGVVWAIGSGAADPRNARFVGLNAQLAAANDPATSAHGGDAWMYAITAGAAKALGIEDVGRIANGMRADLLIWSGDPGSPGSRPERVFVAGEVVLEASKGGS